MAEFVQLRKEKWVDVLEAVGKLKILKEGECQSFVKSLDSHEYKIQSPNRKLEDVLGYIHFLYKSLKLIQRRRKERQQLDETDVVDRFIYNEMTSQFGSAEINFGHMIDFWNARLKFVALIVPEQDRENEFSRVFDKALMRCAGADLSFYKRCVDFEWSLLKTSPALHPSVKKRRKVKRQRRDCSQLMNTIRKITMTAQRNFPRSAEASIWVIITELQYLGVLREEEETNDANDRSAMPFDITDETEKTGKVIQVLWDSFQKKQLSESNYCQLVDAVSDFNVPQAKLLSRTVLNHILQFNPRPLEVSSWLITKSFNENRIDECLERISQALSISSAKVKAASMCMEKLNAFFQKKNLSKLSKSCLPKLIRYGMPVFRKERSEWSEMTSEIYLSSRVNFIKTLTDIQDSSDFGLDEELRLAIKTYLNEHPLEEIILTSIKQCPSSFPLARETVYHLLSQEGKPVKPATIFKYLSAVNWTIVKENDAMQFFNFIYREFKISPDSKKRIDNLLKLPIKHTAMDKYRIIHLKLSYIEHVDVGRKFYLSCKELSSDWRFACAAVEIEKYTCHGPGKKASPVFEAAMEDAQRWAGTSSTEPWKTCVLALRAVGNETKASQLLERTLPKFSASNDEEKYRDLLMFSKSFKNSAS